MRDFYNRGGAPRWPSFNPTLAIIGLLILNAVLLTTLLRQLGVIQ